MEDLARLAQYLPDEKAANGLAFGLAALLAVIAPMILAFHARAVWPPLLSILLTGGAVAISALMPTVFGMIIGGMVWLGALIIGAAAYAASVVATAIADGRPRPSGPPKAPLPGPRRAR